MNYVQFHVGDWDSSTRLLSPLEKGVYIDLLMLYYSVERPLMRSECERISRAYAPEEKAALEYVLDRFSIVKVTFMRIAGAMKRLPRPRRSPRRPRSLLKPDGIRAQGERKPQTQMQTTCKTDALAMRTQMRTECKRIANAMRTQC